MNRDNPVVEREGGRTHNIKQRLDREGENDNKKTLRGRRVDMQYDLL